jgi:EAL domain-containing protein (putative c-di-GMP-specific phosphodiesterase class I)
VVAMAGALDRTLILEGIETETQALGLGCRFAQGYHFGRPCPRSSSVRDFSRPAR